MLQLEHDEYSKIILADVNNYIAVNKAGKYKCKGRFEFEDLALHKNKSFLIIPKAIFNYFINNIPPEKYLAENKNIFDYCAGIKTKSDWNFVAMCHEDGNVTTTKLQKIVRYYISNKGCKILKRHRSDGREIQIESGRWMQTIFDKYEEAEWKDYDINDAYYLDKIYKEIHNVCPVNTNQLKLF